VSDTCLGASPHHRFDLGDRRRDARAPGARRLHVALHSRSSADVGKRMAGELAGASYHQADLADEQATRDLVARLGASGTGRLDVLVNNAGAVDPHPACRPQGGDAGGVAAHARQST
jgi:NAD(P)-dependent dehydrogenase (short-subunit alcohol dehydrogenase family)